MTCAERLTFCGVVEFQCALKEEHKIYLFVNVAGGEVEKCGQRPSYASLVQAQDAELTKLLSKDDRREYNKAIGLAAHDAGIGAYTYLRRIFERLISSRFHEHQAAKNWKDEDFKKLRMNEKIAFLKEFLPELLVKNSAAYSILSEGLHTLSEEQCLNFFPVLRDGVLLVLEQDRELKERANRESAFTKAISAYNSGQS
jgi:hypothetical protein